MSEIEKLKTVTLFNDLSESMLSEFVGYFKRTDYAAGGVIFRRNAGRHSLHNSGRRSRYREGPGRGGPRVQGAGHTCKRGFFGEMAVIEGQTRFAQARASKDSSLYEIDRKQFFSFIKDHPETGISIFREIMKALLKRLQHTSSELTMLFDLSRQLMAQHKSPAEFLAAVMEEMRPYFEGTWNIHAFTYNVFNEELNARIRARVSRRKRPHDSCPPGPRAAGSMNPPTSWSVLSGAGYSPAPCSPSRSRCRPSRKTTWPPYSTPYPLYWAPQW